LKIETEIKVVKSQKEVDSYMNIWG